jgi:adenosylhomocysteine nucleosidase
MTRIAIIAALPGELKPLVKGWRHERRDGVDLWRWKFDEGEWIAACAGAGVERARRAFLAAESDGPLASVYSIGWVGALSEECQPGMVYRVSGVIDALTGERFRPGQWSEERWLVTTARVADHPEKQRLAESYGAALVDMEAASVARLAAMRGIPFYGIKGVSDGFHENLPDFNRFLDAEGQMGMARLIVFALLHPRYWPALMRMGENSKRAALAMAGELRILLAAQTAE